MTLARPFLALFLILVMGLTTASMAVARVGMGFGGTVTFCIGHVTIEIPLDADGTPREHGHFCPDCTLGALAPAPAADTLPGAPRRLLAVDLVPVRTAMPALRPHHGGTARAPPV